MLPSTMPAITPPERLSEWLATTIGTAVELNAVEAVVSDALVVDSADVSFVLEFDLSSAAVTIFR